MEVFLYNSTVCRLCGEENDNGTLLYSCEENRPCLSEVINTYLPIKVSDDGQLPRTICPGCTIQLEATVEFLTLIVNGQKVLRELHLREREYKKTMFNPAPEQDVITEKIVFEVNTSNGVYQVEHPIALQVAGLDKPKRKRGRPPKKHKTPEELAQEAAAKQRALYSVKRSVRDEEPTGKRRRKTPTRFREAVQGKELDRIFKEEGVTDGEESDREVKPKINVEVKTAEPKEPEVIGHLEDSGEVVLFVKGKGRGRPKGPMRVTRKECAICGMEFSCTGRYMSHVAHHGPVTYQCSQCNETFETQINFNNHQKELGHVGKNVISTGNKIEKKNLNTSAAIKVEPLQTQSVTDTPDVAVNMFVDSVMTALPDLSTQPDTDYAVGNNMIADNVATETTSSPSVDNAVQNPNTSSDVGQDVEKSRVVEQDPPEKSKLKCPHCDKMFSSKQSKSMHIKAAHLGERPYACSVCDARFAYPRSLSLHAVAHRRQRSAPRGFACDLCGKVLNHPSSVVYHKEAEHAGQRYVCNKCGKLFKHKQLLQRHQLVHSQVRPYTCKTCEASFKTKANLVNHQLLHTGVKKFSCEICKHKFAHKTSLTLHMRWHTGQKPYTCGVCGKSFSQKGNLSEHSRIHTGEKPFQCALCPRRFTTSSQHRLHARRHAHERPLACAHCPRRFHSRAAAAAHARRSCAPARGHRCATCGRSFASRWPLLKHMRTHRAHKQVHKQVSLLANSQPQQVTQTVVVPSSSPVEVKLPVEDCQEDSSLDERVIYVAYDVDEPDSPAFHILSPEQAAGLDKAKVLTTCELYSGPSLIVPQPELEHLELETEQLELEPEQLELEPEQLELEQEQLEQGELEQLQEQLEIDGPEHMPVTDEQGNPLHFTMQDGTRLAITSADGKSLQVITQDGQTIPVEINGYADEEEVDNEDTIVHRLNLQKSVDSVSSPVTHYFTIV